jgi:hypothetical protein
MPFIEADYFTVKVFLPTRTTTDTQFVWISNKHSCGHLSSVPPSQVLWLSISGTCYHEDREGFRYSNAPISLHLQHNESLLRGIMALNWQRLRPPPGIAVLSARGLI